MSFGVIIVCSEKDFGLAKGCLASVKYFMPQVETCLLIDGNPDYSEAVALYGCKILQKTDIKNEFLRNHSFGWGVTKMNAFWESPFERFLLLDADTCVWGDIVGTVNWGNYDMIIDQPQYNYDYKSINTWFFNTEKLKNIDSNFVPHDFSDKYFCTGMLFSKKNIFPIEWYQQLHFLVNEDPELFINKGEMGMLNYMIFKLVSEARIRVKSQYMQFICADYDLKNAKQLFSFKNGVPIVKEPMVIHYVGDWKPYLGNPISHYKPMTYFRKLYFKGVNPRLSNQKIKELLRQEDLFYAKKDLIKSKLKRLVSPLIKPMYMQIKNMLSR